MSQSKKIPKSATRPFRLETRPDDVDQSVEEWESLSKSSLEKELSHLPSGHAENPDNSHLGMIFSFDPTEEFNPIVAPGQNRSLGDTEYLLAYIRFNTRTTLTKEPIQAKKRNPTLFKHGSI